jgi:hypothetical protein
VSSLLDADAFRFACYVLAATAALVAFLVERRARSASGNPVLFPAFWLFQAVLLLAMGAAMASDAADAITDLGRERARADSWYFNRRTFQVPIVAAVGVAWLTSTFIAVWRIPPRRRRYLPSVVLVGALVSFAAIRAVSLHQIDSVLYRTDLAGVRLVAILEIALLTALTAATAASVPRAISLIRSSPRAAADSSSTVV